MRILALDLGAKTGYAINHGDSRVSGVWDLSERNGESGMRLVRFHGHLETVRDNFPDLEMIVAEMVYVRFASASMSLGELVGQVKAWRAERALKLTWVPAGTLKKYATGSGAANKAAMMAAAKGKGWTFADDNEADALWLLEYATKEIVR